MSRIRAGLVGISGYAGMELARLLARHPEMELTMACSRAEAGKPLGAFYPFLRKLPGADLEIEEYTPEAAGEKCDVVFLAVPAGTAMRMAPELLAKGVKVVDFSADFRFRDKSIYEEWYKTEHLAPELLCEAVYGLPELYAAEIANARLVANPGCYPTACILALRAALKHNLIDPATIIIDAKSGASGAGRKAAVATLFCEISDNFRPYGVPGHRHTPEIENQIQRACGAEIRLTFTPQIVPMKRGILASIYATPRDSSLDSERLNRFYVCEWGDSPWIRVLPPGVLPETVSVRGSMFCDISVVMDKRANRVIIFSAIDNLCRGASGQAVANANLMFGLPMNAGMVDLAPLP